MSTISPIPGLSSELHATPLAEYLAAPLAPYLGVLTPLQLDAPQAETAALLTDAALHDLGWLRRVEVRGEDRFRWLSGMVTNAVEPLPDRTGAYNLVLNAQGRIQGDACVWRSGDSLELEIAANQAEALLTHFDRFIVMDDVELLPLADRSAIGLTGPQATKVLATLGLPALSEPMTFASTELNGILIQLVRGHGAIVPHYAIWAESSQIPALWQALKTVGATPVGTAALETLRVAEGMATYGIDIQSRDLPQETSLVRALSFTKGCYLGQEIVERIRSRGQVHRHLRPLELFPASPEAELPSAGLELRKHGSAPDAKPAGEVTSIAAAAFGQVRRVFALAMIRAEAEIGNPQLEYPGGTARILTAPPVF